MPTIPDLELQCPLLHHGLVHLNTAEISVVYAACVKLRETIEGDREWLYGNCLHASPHSYGDVPVVNKWGARRWYRDGKLHRGGDLPAGIYANGTLMWYKQGKQHRDGDLPAVIGADGTQFWFKNGKRHHRDLPTTTVIQGRS